jgi:hypothetical protein
MAAVIYRCQVSDECPTASGAGWCANHPTSPLRPERRKMPPPPPPPDPTGAQASGPDPSPTPDPGGPPPAQRLPVALRLLGELLELPPDGMELGRDAPRCADLPGMSDLTQVSRSHARLSWRDNVLIVEDLRSLNGTFVNGEMVLEPRPLFPGQMLRLGQDVEVEVVELQFDEDGTPL